jgi:hypothetical protein
VEVFYVPVHAFMRSGGGFGGQGYAFMHGLEIRPDAAIDSAGGGNGGDDLPEDS